MFWDLETTDADCTSMKIMGEYQREIEKPKEKSIWGEIEEIDPLKEDRREKKKK